MLHLVLIFFRILCSCYDNTLRLWTREEKCLTTIPGHSGPVKCVAWLNNNGGYANILKGHLISVGVMVEKI